MLAEGLDYIRSNIVSLYKIELVADRVLNRIEEFWDNVVHHEDDPDFDLAPSNSLLEDIKEHPLVLDTETSKKKEESEKSTPEKNSSSEGALVIDESGQISDHDLFAESEWTFLINFILSFYIYQFTKNHELIFTSSKSSRIKEEPLGIYP